MGYFSDIQKFSERKIQVLEGQTKLETFAQTCEQGNNSNIALEIKRRVGDSG